MGVFQPTEPPDRRAARSRLLALLGFVGLGLLLLGAQAGAGLGVRPYGWPDSVWVSGDATRWLGLAGLLALYGSVGVAAWLVWRRVDVGLRQKRAALRCWGWVLLLSALWPAALWGAGSSAAALGVMAAALVMLGLTLRAFLRVQRNAALLLLPYAASLCWAAYINALSF